jgi:polyisoprenoid-binding protein YceI
MNKLASSLVVILALHAPGALGASYTADPATSRISFAFIQAGAENTGRFRQFSVGLALDDRKPATNRLDVRIEVASLDTQDEERDEVLRSSDLFDVAKHPLATFSSTDIRRTAPGRYEARGKLTMRGVSREVRVPFSLTDGRMSGGAMIRRLDFGVGQGEWESTEWVGNGVKVTFALRLVPKKD